MNTCGFCGQPSEHVMHFCQSMVDAMPKGERVGRRVFALGPETEARAKLVMEYAATHPHFPGESPTPGTISGHVLEIPFGIRAVYTHTKVPNEDRFIRFLSISIDRHGLLPAPEVAFPIVYNLFGFDPAKTARGFNEEENTVFFQEPLGAR